MGKGVEQDVVKFFSTVLGIVVLIVLVTNAGGIAEIGKTLFGGLNSTVGTLLDRQARG